MRLRLIAVSAIALLAACNKTPAASDQAGVSDQGAAAASGQAAPASDAQAAAMQPSVALHPTPMQAPDFVAAAAASDMYEVAAAKIAEKRSMNADVKAFAKMMVTDHTKSTAKIKKAIAASGEGAGMPLPTALPDKQKAMIDALNSASDSDFDKTYMQQQLDGHQDALNLMTGYAKDGDVAPLKQAAKEIVPVVQMHLDKVRAIQTGLGK